jgi:hypothetical protein
VSDDLVAVEIEVDPVVRTSSLGALQQVPIETTGGGDIVDRKGEVEWRKAHDCPVVMNFASVQSFVSLPTSASEQAAS